MNCKNCQFELNESSDYCPSCGAKVIRKRLTLRNLLQHFGETFLNYDNKFLRTIIDLIAKPEKVINGYINGVRKRYINPISFFAISLTISGFSILIIKKYYSHIFDFSKIYENEAQQKMMSNIMEGSFEYNSLVYSALIPFFAIISLLVFFNKKFNLTEHIVIYLYSMSLFSIMGVVFGQIILFFDSQEIYMQFSIGIYILIFIYHCYMLKRVINLTIYQLVLKTLLFLVLFAVLYVILSIIAFFLMVTTGMVNLEDFAPK